MMHRFLAGPQSSKCTQDIIKLKPSSTGGILSTWDRKARNVWGQRETTKSIQWPLDSHKQQPGLPRRQLTPSLLNGKLQPRLKIV